jgi:hypothetical protein
MLSFVFGAIAVLIVLGITDLVLGPFKEGPGAVDHIALQSLKPSESAKWYSERFFGTIMYSDEEWALVKFDNISVAFVLPDAHPSHIAFEVKTIIDDSGFGRHRDGSMFKYERDKWGNTYELICYNKKRH